MANFYPLTVVDVRRETRDSVVLTLGVPEDQRATFRFKQGQYLTFRTQLDGEEVRRSYSICAAIQDTFVRIGIKKVLGGLFSTWANEEVRPGHVLEAMPPMGNFSVPLDPANRKHYLGFAAGSGITPVLGVLKTTLLTEPHSTFTLIYSNRASSTIMFREELEDLKDQFLSRFSLIHILSREQQDIELFNGRITMEKCEQLFKHWIDIKRIDDAFICGPQEMMLQTLKALQRHGLPKARIKFELFASDGQQRERKVQVAPVAVARDLCAATVILDGVGHRFDIPKHTDTILDTGLREGLGLPYACKAGVCSTCRAMLVEGEVDMDAHFALEDYEIARGYILTCQSYPVTDKVVVDYDR